MTWIEIRRQCKKRLNPNNEISKVDEVEEFLKELFADEEEILPQIEDDNDEITSII